MKKCIVLFLVGILFAACSQTPPEKHQVDLGFFTPYVLYPEVLNGMVKEVYERNYIANEVDGEIVKGDRITLAARDTVGWTKDFHLLYDENGNLMKCEILDENDMLIQVERQTYEGNKIVSSEELKDDTVQTISKVMYDENGFMSSMEIYKPQADTFMYSVDIINDENGNQLEWHIFSAWNKSTSKYIFTVDENARRTSYKYINTKGEAGNLHQFSYNEKGFMSTWKSVGSDGIEETHDIKYSYDEMDNWLVAIYTISTPPHHIITERVITYFEE